MNRLSVERRAQVIGALVEGNSIRATCRMAGTAKGTVLRLLEAVGAACSKHQDAVLRDLPCQRLQCDEIWSFCYAKQKNVSPERQGEFGAGDVWTWTAIDADTKLVPSWLIGLRDAGYAYEFMMDLARRPQIPRPTNDGRTPTIPDGGRGCFRGQCRLRRAHEAVRDTSRARDTVQPRPMHRDPANGDTGQSRPCRGVH